MKKKILPLIIATLVVSLINTGLLTFFAIDKITNGDGIGFSSNKKVVISRDYDKGQSYEKAQKTGKPMIVWFYTDWCGYCQKFAPTFKKLTKLKEIKSNFAIAYVNAEQPENKPLTEEYEVKGYPTLYLVNGDKKEMVPPMWLFQDGAIEKLKTNFLSFLR